MDKKTPIKKQGFPRATKAADTQFYIAEQNHTLTLTEIRNF